MSQELGPEIVEIDALLERAGRAFAYPATPPLAEAVLARLPAVRPSQTPFDAVRRWWQQPAARIVTAAVTTVALVAGGALAVPQSRSALADLFGLSHARIDVVTPGLTTPTPPVRPAESFARPVTLQEAQAAVNFPLRVPHEGGVALEPDAVLLVERSTPPVAVFTYEEFDLYETRDGTFIKNVAPELIHEVEFRGEVAYWIDQGGHIASFLDEQGNEVLEYRRTVERATLLWEEGGVTYRLETSLSQEEALRVAESVR